MIYKVLWNTGWYSYKKYNSEIHDVLFAIRKVETMWPGVTSEMKINQTVYTDYNIINTNSLIVIKESSIPWNTQIICKQAVVDRTISIKGKFFHQIVLQVYMVFYIYWSHYRCLYYWFHNSRLICTFPNISTFNISTWSYSKALLSENCT